MAGAHNYKGRLEAQIDGVSGSAGYVNLVGVGDATLSMSRPSDSKPRRGSEFKTYVTGQIEMDISATIVWDDADAVVAALENAYINNTHIGVKFLDKAAGGGGVVADFLVESWGLSQPDSAGQQTVPLKLIPTFVDTEPAHI